MPNNNNEVGEVEEVEEQEVPVSETQQESYEKQIKELKAELDEVKNERMSARRKKTKAIKEADEKLDELKEELEVANNKSTVYFRKMRKAQDDLADLTNALKSSLRLSANMLSNTHNALALALEEVSKSERKRMDVGVPKMHVTEDQDMEG